MNVWQVSYWVASEICCVDDARLRGVLLEKFIEVAKVRPRSVTAFHTNGLLNCSSELLT